MAASNNSCLPLSQLHVVVILLGLYATTATASLDFENINIDGWWPLRSTRSMMTAYHMGTTLWNLHVGAEKGLVLAFHTGVRALMKINDERVVLVCVEIIATQTSIAYGWQRKVFAKMLMGFHRNRPFDYLSVPHDGFEVLILLPLEPNSSFGPFPMVVIT
ncbi:hypothetical protein AXF42_Ash015904 [Apostasia shenzhenica]|uniref:Uncharacterized protein n=1 Tax=Apostasia shenzhenica TaxID=1088818 RepID=A0A2I0AWF5_9ASPA|nr:hypothetical protein AXF42_Ash015904 [Apostasia shenzhenica]